jgi:hypothetical protein
MGALIASGASVPLSVIEGVTVAQTDALAEHGINDIDALTQTSVDDLVEFLDLSLDEAEVILNAAKAVVAMRDRTLAGAEESEAGETALEEGDDNRVAAPETNEADDAAANSAEDATAAGYDEAVEAHDAFIAEPEILAQYSADPVALTEVEATSEDSLLLQEAGRDLRPDTIVPAPDVTSAEAAAIESLDEFELAGAEADDEMNENEQPTAPASDAATGESNNEEKQDASPDAAN